jgi:hypothetical protein
MEPLPEQIVRFIITMVALVIAALSIAAVMHYGLVMGSSYLAFGLGAFAATRFTVGRSLRPTGDTAEED